MSNSIEDVIGQLFNSINTMNEQIKEINTKMGLINTKIDVMSSIISSDHSIYFVDSGSEGCFKDVLDRTVKGPKILSDFCCFLKELEKGKWECDTFIKNLSDDFKQICTSIFNFPRKQHLYIRNCYNDLFVNSSQNGIYLLSGSPGTGKTTFIIYHMKRKISENLNNNLILFLSVGVKECLEARRSSEGVWKVYFSSIEKLLSHNIQGEVVCAYLDNSPSLIHNNEIIQLHTLSAGNPMLISFSKIENVKKIYIDPWRLWEFDKIMKELGFESETILQREFSKKKMEWYIFLRQLFKKEQISIYEVVGLNIRLLLQPYDKMNNELEMMIENLMSQDFVEKWVGTARSFLESNFLYHISKNNHLIHSEPTNDRRSYNSIFGSPLLITSLSSVLKDAETNDLYNLYKRGRINPSFPRTALGIIYESLLTKILKKDKTVCAVIDFCTLKNNPICEFIDLNNQSYSPIPLKKEGFFTDPLSLNTFYYQEGNSQWDLIDYMKILKYSNNDEKVLIGIQATVGQKHQVSHRGAETIKWLMSKYKINYYYHIFFVPDISYFTPPSLSELDIPNSSIHVCQVSIEINLFEPKTSNMFSTPIAQKQITDTEYTPTTSALFESISKKLDEFFELDKDIFNIEEKEYYDVGYYYRFFKKTNYTHFDMTE